MLFDMIQSWLRGRDCSPLALLRRQWVQEAQLSTHVQEDMDQYPSGTNTRVLLRSLENRAKEISTRLLATSSEHAGYSVALVGQLELQEALGDVATALSQAERERYPLELFELAALAVALIFLHNLKD